MCRSQNPTVPQQTAPLLALATQLLRAGQPADAIAPLREAALLQPSDPIIQHDLGLACLEAGRIPDAIAALQRAVASNPRYADAYFRLGVALEKLGDIGGAIVAYDRATEFRPPLTEAWFRAGALVYTLGHRDEAIGCFRRAATTGGETSFGRLGKARALLTEDRNQEAEQVLRRTLRRDPKNAMAHDLLGNLLSEFGRFDEARACFQRAIAIAPLLAGCYYDMVRCRPVRSEEAGLLQEMEAALDTPGLEAAQRVRLHLALGKATDAIVGKIVVVASSAGESNGPLVTSPGIDGGGLKRRKIGPVTAIERQCFGLHIADAGTQRIRRLVHLIRAGCHFDPLQAAGYIERRVKSAGLPQHLLDTHECERLEAFMVKRDRVRPYRQLGNVIGATRGGPGFPTKSRRILDCRDMRLRQYASRGVSHCAIQTRAVNLR
ncbi:MAG: tetratricopeptide repeat protein [Acidobacteriaceae bacterium]